MEIASSARKHLIPDADIVHAVRHQMRVIRLASDRTLIIGARRSGAFLEIVVLTPSEDEEPIVIHAMELRTKFYKYL